MMSRLSAKATKSFCCALLAAAFLLTGFDAAAADLADDDPQEILHKGLAAYRNGELEEARALLLPLAVDVDNATPTSKLALFYVLQIGDQIEQELKDLLHPTVDGGISAFNSRRYNVAAEILEPFADQNDPEALMYLGLIIVRTSDSWSEGIDAATPLFERAANLGLGRAQYFMSQLPRSLADLRGVEQSLVWAEKAARNGIGEAYPFVANTYCALGKPDQSNAWRVLTDTDPGFRADPEAFEAQWTEIKEHWELYQCWLSSAVTKDFVRNIHRNAEELIRQYGLRVCSPYSDCSERNAPDLFSRK